MIHVGFKILFIFVNVIKETKFEICSRILTQILM